MKALAFSKAASAVFVVIAILAGLDGRGSGVGAQTAGAGGGPAFVDERRLPQDGEALARQRESEESLQRLKSEAEELRKKLAQEAEARRKAEDAAAAKRAESESQAKAAADADAKRKAEEAAAAQRAEAERQAKAAADADAKRKAEEAAAAQRAEAERQAKAAADAEAKRNAEEAAAAQRAEAERQAKAAADADAKRNAEEAAAAQRAQAERQAKAAADADAKRKAEEAAAAQRAEAERQAKAAADADAKRNAEEAAAAQRAEAERQAKAAADAKASAAAQDKSKAAAGAIAARMAPNQTCNDVETDSQILPGATLAVFIKSTCLAGQKVTMSYGDHNFVHHIPASGEATLHLDLFAGALPAALVLSDGQRAAIDTSGADFSQISKVAVIWSNPVNLDLHALEYLAVRGGAGHVWSGAPSSREQSVAASRDGAQGRGFMSRIDDGSGEGTKVEVYTFWHKTGQRNGAVTLFIDHASRGETPTGDFCGNGAMARVEASVVRLRPGGKVEAETVRLGPAACGQKLRDAERFNPDTLSHLLARG